jgi:hypothetical protein
LEHQRQAKSLCTHQRRSGLPAEFHQCRQSAVERAEQTADLNGQLNHTYIFSPNVTNQFIASAFYYSWPFGPANLQQTLAASPAQFNNNSDGGTNFSVGLGRAGRVGFDWGSNPTSTNSTQYQFVDDLSWLKGNHTLKFGFNFKRYDVTDGYPTVNT